MEGGCREEELREKERERKRRAAPTKERGKGGGEKGKVIFGNKIGSWREKSMFGPPMQKGLLGLWKCSVSRFSLGGFLTRGITHLHVY